MCNPQQTEELDRSRSAGMYVRPKYRRPANAAFIDHVGNAIRQATSDIVQAELPEDIRSLLNALERLEQERARTDSEDSSKA
jgi:hypothetical protein